jgi:hypothetical protein
MWPLATECREIHRRLACSQPAGGRILTGRQKKPPPPDAMPGGREKPLQF